MDERELLENWGKQKQSHTFQRLRSSTIAEYEFIGQRGHPSSYSYVKFRADPADEFKWDTIGGSEAAVHSATLLAICILVADGDWEQVTGRYRAY
jgi:hypothetical protein